MGSRCVEIARSYQPLRKNSMNTPEFTEFTLYKGKVKGKFYPKSHAYYVNGKRKTGVTTYIGIIDKSRPLIYWATELYRDFLLAVLPQRITEEDIYTGCSLHAERKEEAANIGDEVHKWIEQYILNENPEMPDSKEAQIGVNAFLEWTELNKVKFISSERIVYSLKHDYVGKMDIEAEVNGKLCLIDIKTSNGLYNTYALQTAAYVKADEEESERKYQGRWLIRVSKETEEEYLARMEKKNINREKKGQNRIEVSPYKVFEARFLDDQETNIDRDFKAYLNAKSLHEWNKETDFFTNKEA